MRWTILVLALIACAAVVLHALRQGAAVDAVSSAPTGDPPRREDSTRIEAELDRGAVEVSSTARTEAAPPTSRLEIRIVDESGKTRPGIRLRLLRRQDARFFGRIGELEEDHPWIRTTDADGLAIWDELQPAVDCRWAAYHALVDYQPAPVGEETGWSGSFAQVAGETTRLTGRLASTLAVVGQVQDRDGKPLSGVRLTALRRDVDERSFVTSATTDAEGRFALRRVRIVPLRLECVTYDAPGLLTLVTRDVDPPRGESLDLGVWKLEGRTVHVALRAVDGEGRDVTDQASIEGGRHVPLWVDGCGELRQQIRIPLGGSFRMIGFECPNVAISIAEDPPVGSSAPSWALAWDRSYLEIREGTEGHLRLDVLAMPAEEVSFTASGIRRAGVADQRGVAVLKVSLAPEEGSTSIDFEMRALLGLAFDGVHSIPPGKYRLEATCEDDGALWTATREVVVAKPASEPVRIDLIRER